MNAQKHCWRQGVDFYLFFSVFCILTVSPTTLLAHSVKGWGNMAIDSSNFIGSRFTAIAAGSYHSLALKSDGSIVGWGCNGHSQADPCEGNDFVAIAAGGEFSLALRRHVCQFNLVGDLNNDCKVDMLDFALMANNWLIDCDAEPDSPACTPK